MAPVVRECRRRRVSTCFIHTGQHYSFELDGVFIEELRLPKPHHNLHAGSGSHGAQAARMIEGLERLYIKEKPDVVLVEGDTNSVLAGGLAASKLGIPVGHVEAGLRSGDRRMPEEINRILVDHLSDLLFAPTLESKRLLVREGVSPSRIFVTGNTVVDELKLQKPRGVRAARLDRLGVEEKGYILATIHRPETTDDPRRLLSVIEGVRAAGEKLKLQILLPLHPRTRMRLADLGWKAPRHIRVLPPQGYLEFLGLQIRAALVLTDSGGIQEEACCLGVPCVTLRDSTERPESVAAGANCLAGTDPRAIVRAAAKMNKRKRNWKNPFGDGHAARRIVDIVIQQIR
jgi:UDP-N-acetylglucosamine 2-epimerase (non-hydrolysing)